MEDKITQQQHFTKDWVQCMHTQKLGIKTL